MCDANEINYTFLLITCCTRIGLHGFKMWWFGQGCKKT